MEEKKWKACRICNARSRVVATKKISFLFKGFEILVFKGDDICAFCAKTRYLASHEKELSDSVFQVGAIDWERYVFLDATARDETPSATHWNRITHILVDMEILSPKKYGNWSIIAYHEITLNPRISPIWFYFIRKEDALRFAKIKGRDTMYEWSVSRIGFQEGFSKKEVLALS